MNTVSESLGNVRQAPTAGAYLRCVVGVDPDKHAPSLFHFVGELGQERTPGCIVDRPRQHSARQAINVQVFNGDKPVVVGQSTAELVLEVGTLIPNVHVGLLEKADGSAPTCAALLPSGDLALATPELGQPPFEVTGIGHQRTVRESGERSQPHIDPDYARPWYRCGHIDDNREAGIPLVGLPFERERLNLASDRSVHLELDDAHALDSKPTRLGQVAAIAPGREAVAVEAVPTLEAGVARLLAGSHSAEEGGKGLVDPSEHVLTGREVGQVKITGAPYLFELIRLVVVVPAYPLHPPGITALLKGGIVKKSGLRELVLQARHLVSRGIQAVFECLAHLLTLLRLDVVLNRRGCHRPHAGNEVGAAPQSRQTGTKLGELSAQNVRCVALELGGDTGRRPGRVSLYKQVNVVRHDFEGMNLRPQLRCLRFQQPFQSDSHFTFQDRPSVLRAPDKVILQCKYRTSVLDVFSSSHESIIQRGAI